MSLQIQREIAALRAELEERTARAHAEVAALRAELEGRRVQTNESLGKLLEELAAAKDRIHALEHKRVATPKIPYVEPPDVLKELDLVKPKIEKAHTPRATTDAPNAASVKGAEDGEEA